MTSRKQFQPNWVSPPGETISDILQQKKLTTTHFGEQIGKSPEDVIALLEGRATITISTAKDLSRVLGGSPEFWVLRDHQYREDTASRRESDSEWISELPIGDMIKFGWLAPVPHPQEEIKVCLNFFGVTTVKAWREEYSSVFEAVRFRRSPSFDSKPGAIAAWLRRGEIVASQIDCRPWDAEKFRAALEQIRPLTQRKDPENFLPEVTRRCAEAGVAATVVRSPAGSRVSGATRFLSKDKALLLLSFRYLSDDHFWFTFFHEAGHLLLHGSSKLFLEGTEIGSTAEERQASQFAEETLIPPIFRPRFMKLHADSREIIRFAVEVGVSPGIVVGQLQHSKRLGQSQLNGLKRRYTWAG